MYTFNGLLLLALAFALREAFGQAVALGALLFLAIDPTVAAHLPVVMTDLPVALCSAIAVALAACAFQTWKWSHLAACAGAVGLALATKHSAPIVLLSVVTIGIWLTFIQGAPSHENSRVKKIGKVAALLAGAMIILWAAYFFQYAESPSGRESFNQPLAQKVADVQSPYYRGVLTLMDKTRVVPRAYLWGFADTIHAGLEGREHHQIFLGKFYPIKAPRYFFPTMIGVKLPVGLSVLVLLGLFFFFMRQVPQEWQLPGGIVLTVAVLFLLVLCGGATYGGVRHALPVIVLLSIFAGIGVTVAIQSSGRTAKVIVAVAILAACVSALPQMRPWGSSMSSPTVPQARTNTSSMKVLISDSVPRNSPRMPAKNCSPKESGRCVGISIQKLNLKPEAWIVLAATQNTTNRAMSSPSEPALFLLSRRFSSAALLGSCSPSTGHSSRALRQRLRVSWHVLLARPCRIFHVLARHHEIVY